MIYYAHGIASELASFGKNLILYEEKKTIKKSDHVLVPSLCIKNKLISKYNIDESKITVIPYGINTKLFKPDKKAKQKNTFLFVGRFEKRKGIEHLIKAVKLCEKDFKIFFVGDGKLKQGILDLCENDKRAEYLGAKTHKNIVLEMQKASFLICPSLSEGLPYVVLEAMSCGTPVITTRPIACNIIKEGINGFKIEPNAESIKTKIEFLLQNKINYNKISKNAKNTVLKNNSWPIIMNKIFSVIK